MNNLNRLAASRSRREALYVAERQLERRSLIEALRQAKRDSQLPATTRELRPGVFVRREEIGGVVVETIIR